MAVLHGLGTGTDTPVHWVLGLTVACVALIAALTGWRLAYGWPSHAAARLVGALALVLTLIAGGAWLSRGAAGAGLGAAVRHAAAPGHRRQPDRPGTPVRRHPVSTSRGDQRRRGRGPRARARRAAPADPAAGGPLTLADHVGRYGPVPFRDAGGRGTGPGRD